MILRDNNLTGLDGLIKSLKGLSEKNVYVGVPSSSNASAGDGMNMATLLKIHEFGARIQVTEKMRGYLAYSGLFLKKTTGFIVIPERSVLRSTFSENASAYVELLKDNIPRAIATGRTAEDVLNLLGNKVSNDVKLKFGYGLKPNHPFTVQRKGSSAPLVDSGELRNSITWEVK